MRPTCGLVARLSRRIPLADVDRQTRRPTAPRRASRSTRHMASAPLGDSIWIDGRLDRRRRAGLVRWWARGAAAACGHEHGEKGSSGSWSDRPPDAAGCASGRTPVGLGACTDLRRSRWRGASAGARIAGWIAGASWRCVAAGIVVLAVAAAARHPDLAPGGGSRAALALQLAAGLALVAAAAAHGSPRRARRGGGAARRGGRAGVGGAARAAGERRAVHAHARRRGPSGGRRRARGAAVSRRAPGGGARPRRDRGRLRRDRRAAAGAGLRSASGRLLRLPGQPAAVRRRPRCERLAGALDATRGGSGRGRARRAGRRAAAASSRGRPRARGAGLRRRRGRARAGGDRERARRVAAGSPPARRSRRSRPGSPGARCGRGGPVRS